MVKETMTEVDESVLRHKYLDQNEIFNQYEAIVTSLKEELNKCKLEQNKLRLEVESLRKDNQNACETIQRSLTECDHESCTDPTHNKEAVTNLEKRITILQMEKDSIFQLWQMALKAIDVLEEELKTVHRDDKSTKFYQQHVNSIKESYSEAIKKLEFKLSAAKENFFQQQALWEKSKEKIDQLTKEKNDMVQQLQTVQEKALEKEKDYQSKIDSLKGNLTLSKAELVQIKKSKTEQEEKLKSAQHFASAMISKDLEAKSKVSEAVDLIESAVREKEAILKREARIIEEKSKLEASLTKISEEYTTRLENEVVKAKEIYNKNVKKYLIEIKELKAELREKVTLLDRSQREYRLMEEELETVKRNSDNYLEKSNVRILNLKQSLQGRDMKLHTNEDSHKTIYDDRIYYLENQISILQEKLSNTTDKLRRAHLQSSRDVEDHVREADDRSREIIEKCSNFERQLSRTLIDKETLASNLHALEMSFEKEMQKRNHERILLENKVRDLQEKVLITEGNINSSRILSDDVLNKKTTGQQTLMNFDSITNILTLQEKFDKKTKELNKCKVHVETYQKLSDKWKEEANLLTSKFQKRTQELRNQISALRKQNEELARELLFYQQLVARCNTQFVQNYNKETNTT